MADDINKKISINVEVSSNGQQQINNYKIAFDNLRNTINGLNNPLNDLSNNISALDKDLSKLSNSGGDANEKVSEITESFVGWSEVVKVFSKTLGEWGIVLSVTMSVLTSYGPEIIKWIGNLFKADTTTKSLNQTLKEHKLVIQAVNQARLQGDQNALQELVHLKLLYGASQDQKLSLTERKKAVADLQQQYPGYLGNISSEAILTGKATTEYNKLTQAILASSRAKAAQDIMVKNSERQLGDEATVTDLKEQHDAKQVELNETIKKFREQMAKSDRDRGGWNDEEYDKIQQLRDDLNVLQKKSNDAANDSRILDKQNAALTKTVTDNIEKQGTQVITGLNNAINSGNQTLKSLKSSNKTNSTPAPQRDSTILGPASSAGISPDDNQSPTTIDPYNIPAIQDSANEVTKVNKTMLLQLADAAKQNASQIASDGFKILTDSIKQQADAKIAALETQKNNELSKTNLTSAQKIAIEAKFKKQEGQIKAKAFKEEQEASVAQAVINGALAITKGTAQTGVLASLYIPSIIAETAIEIAKIESQKPPAYASGGLHYSSDGRGGLLPGYSRTDNTNAHLRSGEGVVVSEAMRNPWARNLVSAINVGFGGRDFSTGANGRNFAVGGIFTDGGDANRYYNAPVNDQKNLANTIAYQMINNFPPVYVDVKDINNQQNILAQTINRVNL